MKKILQKILDTDSLWISIFASSLVAFLTIDWDIITPNGIDLEFLNLLKPISLYDRKIKFIIVILLLIISSSKMVFLFKEKKSKK